MQGSDRFRAYVVSVATKSYRDLSPITRAVGLVAVILTIASWSGLLVLLFPPPTPIPVIGNVVSLVTAGVFVVLLLVISPYGLWSEERRKNGSLNQELVEKSAEFRERLRPKLTLGYEDSGAFRQTFFAKLGGSFQTDYLIALVYRVGVQNDSDVTIEGVTLRLLSFEPQGAHFLPTALRYMDDTERPFRKSRDGISLHPRSTAHFEVVFRRVQQGLPWFHPVYGSLQDQQEIRLCYANENYPSFIPLGKYVLTLQAFGRDTQSAPERFVVEASGGRDLEFHGPLPKQTAAQTAE